MPQRRGANHSGKYHTGSFAEQELISKFSEFSRKRVRVQEAVRGHKVDGANDAFNELKEAEKLAGEIISLLLDRIKKWK